MKDSIHVSKENYLKAILEAEAEGHQVIPAMLAHWLEVSAPAVTMALKRLKRDGLRRGGRGRHCAPDRGGARDCLSHRAAPPPHRAHAERSLRHGVVRDPRRGRAAGARGFAGLRGQAARETGRGRRLSAWQRGAAGEPRASASSGAKRRFPRLSRGSATP